MTRDEKINVIMLMREKRIREARKSFWEFCKLLSPFHTEDKIYLKELAHDLQEIYEHRKLDINGVPYRHITISLPPRHGKSFTIVLFEAWVLGNDPSTRVATLSFDNPESEKFSEFVRNIIQEKREDYEIEKFVFSDIFHDVKIKKGDSAKQRWSLEGQFSTYKGVGFRGGITGNGYNLMVIDDPHKGAEEAFNPSELEKKYNTYTGTIRNRLERKAGKMGMRIIVQTRWSENDIIGRVKKSEDGKYYYHFVRKACENEAEAIEGTQKPKMLCDSIFNFQDYIEAKKDSDEMIFLANYQQELIDSKDAMYENLQTYDRLPMDESGNLLYDEIINYTDTADEGKDYFASVTALKYQGLLYVLDIIFTQRPMEETEHMLCQSLVNNGVTNCLIEGNNGGRGFARNVQRILLEKYKTRNPSITYFHQSNNKKTRILTNSSKVCNLIRFPSDSFVRFSEAWKSLRTYKRIGNNTHDDIQDAITGLIEMAEKKQKATVRAVASPF